MPGYPNRHGRLVRALARNDFAWKFPGLANNRAQVIYWDNPIDINGAWNDPLVYSCWIYKGGSNSQTVNWYFSFNRGNNNSAGPGLYEGSGESGIAFYVDRSSDFRWETDPAIGSPRVEAGQWVHVLCYSPAGGSATDAIILINGEEAAYSDQIAGSGDITDSEGKWCLGGSAASNGDGAHAALCEVTVWSGPGIPTDKLIWTDIAQDLCRGGTNPLDFVQDDIVWAVLNREASHPLQDMITGGVGKFDLSSAPSSETMAWPAPEQLLQIRPRPYLVSAVTDDIAVADDNVAFAEGVVALTGVGTLAVAADNLAFADSVVDLNAVGSLDVADDEVAFSEGAIDLDAIGTLDVGDDNAAFAEAAIDLNAIGTLDVGDDPALFAEGTIDLLDVPKDMVVTDDNAAFADGVVDLNAVGSLDVADDEAAFAEGAIDLDAIGLLDVAADPLVFADGVINLNAVGTLAVAADNAAFAQGVIGLTAIGTLDVAGGTLIFADGVVALTDAGSSDMVVTDDNASFADGVVDLNAVGVLVVTDDPAAFAESVNVTAIGTLAVAADNASFDEGTIDLTAIGILAVVSNPAAFAEGPVDLTAIGLLQVAADAVAYGEGVINLEDLQVDLAVTSLAAFAEATIDLTDANAAVAAAIQGGGHPDWVIGDQSPEQAEFERAVMESIQLFLSKVL